MTIEHHTALVTLSEIFATKGFESDFARLLIDSCYDGEDAGYGHIIVKSYRMVQVQTTDQILQFDVEFKVPEFKEYEVILSNTFQATSPENAVSQMVDYLTSMDANHFGFRVNFEDPEGLPGMTKTVFVDGDAT